MRSPLRPLAPLPTLPSARPTLKEMTERAARVQAVPRVFLRAEATAFMIALSCAVKATALHNSLKTTPMTALAFRVAVTSIWQVEDLPLLGLYYVEADSRAQQLEVLKKWIEQKSVLLFWCKQFSFIACDKESSLVFITCQEVLLKQLSTLIPDKGHTPKNEDIDVLQSLPKVQIELVKKTEISTELRESGTGEALIDLGPVGTEGVNDASAADPDQGA
ncbi:hypothetical protein LWI29_021249 [Acer saccharum]|uniref:Uncharacterized protein n=1 Tax=Acer saccharum TaxID=4024 RepID=A0AA39VBG1_ACESA|nr:hypothetical protein LWI29_021249 [Acer saccharum]